MTDSDNLTPAPGGSASTPAIDQTGELPVKQMAQRRSRRMLLGILALFAVPLILAALWLQMVRSSDGALGDTSRGDLIRPAVPLQAFAFTDNNNAVFDESSLRGIWTLLYLSEGECADTCQQNLYHMRQVRLALNQRMNRVQRAVLAAPERLGDKLIGEHPGLYVLQGSDAERQAFAGQFSGAMVGMPTQADAIYLIDPLGNLMMRFAPDLPPKSMLKDLKHLLKVSRIG